MYVNKGPTVQGIQRRVMNPDQAVDPKTKINLCAGNVLATTQSIELYTGDQDLRTSTEPMIQIVLCPKFFEEAVMKQKLEGTPKENDYLGDYKYAAGGFLHELFHTYGARCES